MADLTKLTVGLTGTARVIVTADHLANKVGSGDAPVFASPMLIATMEAAAVDCVEHLLPEAHQSLGMHVDVNHTSPTPLGLTVKATAKLTAVAGRKLTFAVSAHDDYEQIGVGSHTRIVVDTARFMARLSAKSTPRA